MADGKDNDCDGEIDKAIQLITEAERRAYADRSYYLGDPDFVDIPTEILTSEAYLSGRMSDFSFDTATPSSTINYGEVEVVESMETTHYSIVDSFGNAIAVTTTLNGAYGSKLYVPELGFFLNNEMDDFSAKPGVANAYGLIGGEANAVDAGKRPLSSMSPTIVFKPDSDEVLLVTGSPGGSRIITTTLQIISNVIDHTMNIAEATQAPRFHHQWLPDKLTLEKGFSADTIRLLQQKGHLIDASRWAMGSTQSILRTDDGWTGASDPRQSGTLTAGH